MTEKPLKILVVKDEKSPTGYTIISGSGAGVPATVFEVRLWNMYLDALETLKRLKDEQEKTL
jgi:hypothetical protein